MDLLLQSKLMEHYGRGVLMVVDRWQGLTALLGVNGWNSVLGKFMVWLGGGVIVLLKPIAVYRSK